METIIGLLFILLPVIFKLIGKKFEQSGQAATARKIREIAEMFGEESDMTPEEFEPEESAPEPGPLPTPVEEPEYKPVQTPVKKPAPAPAPTPESDQSAHKNVIDPKKLVIYSEIMKPKF